MRTDEWRQRLDVIDLDQILERSDRVEERLLPVSAAELRLFVVIAQIRDLVEFAGISILLSKSLIFNSPAH